MPATGGTNARRLAELWELIGAIYDCALAPQGWRDVLRRLCGLLDANTSALYLVDFAAERPRLFWQWGVSEHDAERWQSEFARDVTGMHQLIVSRTAADPEEPIAMSRVFSPEERAAMRVSSDWAVPSTSVMRSVARSRRVH